MAASAADSRRGRLIGALALGVAFGVGLAACDPGTTRPRLLPAPEAPSAPVALAVPAATRQLADALRGDGVPLGRVTPRDGYIESPWFDARTNRPSAHPAPGTGFVRVRAWVDPIDRRHSQLTVESVYRLAVDPSLPPRELERALPDGHPVARRMQHTLDSLSGRLDAARRALQAARDSARADSVRADSTRADSTGAGAARPDSTRADTSRKAPSPRDSTRRDSTAAPPAAPRAPAPRKRDTLSTPADSTRTRRASPTSPPAPR